MPPTEAFSYWLPVIFMALMGLALLFYVILDGYDLGVGILSRRVSGPEKDAMISSIGPFWDANETWLVLGIGILLTAFPDAHGLLLGEMYGPIALMLAALMLRGVSFELRVKAKDAHKPFWNKAFYAGSLTAAFSQGVMLAQYVTGFSPHWSAMVFSGVVGAALVAGYCLMGACWLVMKTEGELQAKAISWAKGSLCSCAAGVVAISAVTPLVNPTIFVKWFSLPNIYWLAPIPVATAGLFVLTWIALTRISKDPSRLHHTPFFAVVGIFSLSFAGLAYSLFPYIAVGRLTVWEAAASVESLKLIGIGAAVVIPSILAYTAFSYWVFRGKARELTYY